MVGVQLYTDEVAVYNRYLFEDANIDKIWEKMMSTEKSEQRVEELQNVEKLLDPVNLIGREMDVLEELEDNVKENLLSIYMLGFSLAQIRSHKLYKLRGFKTFNEYISKYFNRSVDWGRVVASIGMLFNELNKKHDLTVDDMPTDYSALIPILHAKIPVSEAAIKYKAVYDDVITSSDETVKNKRGGAITRKILANHKIVKKLRQSKNLDDAKPAKPTKPSKLADVISAFDKLGDAIEMHLEANPDDNEAIEFELDILYARYTEI